MTIPSHFFRADTPITVLFTTRGAVIAADVIVLLVTWQKTVGIVRQSACLKEQMPLTEVLLRDGELFILIVHAKILLTLKSRYNFLLVSMTAKRCTT